MHIHDAVMHDLLCSTLREAFFGRVDSNVVETFNYQLGAALHNIPHYLRETGTIPLSVCLELNSLDPSAKEGEWGEWVSSAIAKLGQSIEYPSK